IFVSKNSRPRIAALDRVGAAPLPLKGRRTVQARRAQPLSRPWARPLAAGPSATRSPDAARQGSPPPHARPRGRAAAGRRARRAERSLGMLRLRRRRPRPHVDRHARLRIRLGLPLARRAGGLARLLRLPRSAPRRRRIRLALLRPLGTRSPAR